jgi:hypothetical protein
MVKLYILLAIVGAGISLTGLAWAIPEYDQLYKTWYAFHEGKGTDMLMLTNLTTQMQTHRLNAYAEALGSLAGLFTVVGATIGISIERVRLVILAPRS